MSAVTPLGRIARCLLLAVLLGLAVVVWAPSTAWAHTEFDSSDPADGQTVAGSVDSVTVTFTDPASPSGEGFVLLDASGTAVAPAAVETTDGVSFLLVFEPPLGPGEYGVRWEVQAGDAHPIDGTFRFTVTGGATGAAPGLSADAPSADAPSADAPVGGAASTLEEALAQDSGAASPWLLRVARVLVIGGTIVGLGAFVALVAVVRGRPGELRSVLVWVRTAGGAVAVGASVELLALAWAQPGGLGEALGSTAGVAAVLRLIGGVLIAAGLPAGSAGLPAGAAATSSARHRARGPGHGDEALVRWVPSRASATGAVGFALVLASFWFDGHTVTRGPWVLHAAANLVHVVAAAVWAGGVLVMTSLVWRRRRRGLPGDGAWLVIRFSPVAAVSLAAVVLAGALMAVIVLQAPEELWTTEWGRVLLAKVAVVGVAAAMGAVNHRRLRPALERDPTSAVLAVRVRRTLAVESVAFVAVVVLTTWLVAAAT